MYRLVYRDDLDEVYIRILSCLNAYLHWRDDNPHCKVITFSRIM